MKTREKLCQHKKFVLFLDIFAKSTVWYLQFCLTSTNFCFSLMLVNWVNWPAPETNFEQDSFPAYKFKSEGSLCFVQILHSYRWTPTVSEISFLPQFCACLFTALWFYFGAFVVFFLLQRIQGKIMPPVRQLWKSSGFELLENCSTSIIYPA